MLHLSYKELDMKNLFTPEKFVKASLVGIDGNAFALMGHFSSCARRQGWSKEEIKKVTDAAMSGDYNNLIVTLMAHMTED